MLSRILLLAVVLSTVTSSYLLSHDEDVDLQELLQNIPDSDPQQNLQHQHYHQENAKNINLILSENIHQVIQGGDANGKTGDENMNKPTKMDQTKFQQSLDANTNKIVGALIENNKRMDERLQQVLQALGKGSGVPDPKQARDCSELYTRGERNSGIYNIAIEGIEENVLVYCDMKTDGGGWTVFQRRGNYGLPEDYFYRNWTEYKNGFGELATEFWLGNDVISALTKQKPNQLRVDLWDTLGNPAWAKYFDFKVENEDQFYKAHIIGFSGNAGDSLSYHNAQPFSTKDKRHDKWTQSCAVAHEGAWWYNACSHSNLNGANLKGQPTSNVKGIAWTTWKKTWESLAFTEMKIRPAIF